MNFTDILERHNELGFGVRIFREFYVPKHRHKIWEVGDIDLGCYWCWDEETALSYWSRAGFVTSNERWKIESFARSDQIDWDITIRLNECPRGHKIKEIHVFDGAEIPLIHAERLKPIPGKYHEVRADPI